MSLRLAIPFLFATLATTGCGESKEYLNTKKGQEVIAAWFDKQDMETSRVSCPRDIPIAEGTSFTCQVLLANADGLTVEVEVVQTSGSGDIKMSHKEPLLAAERVERGIAGGLRDQKLEEVIVDCGARVRFSKPNQRFLCKVDTRTEDFNVEVTINDEAGTWSAKRQ